MAIDEGLAQRIREALGSARVTERKMFGGIAFMSRGHMFVGIAKQRLMVRVGPAAYDDALRKPHVREMDFTGRPLRGYVYVDAEGIERDEDLAEWVGAGLAFVGTLPAKQR
ncbi:MAG: TfoX/Sxy family protein [Gemmatimonadaceae bacterium]|jgi:TfoX/Sxy family transcriptional regulator of competence genes|nr:TfoX/Sxy family protein [Gemmatimonadaceae bacterium]